MLFDPGKVKTFSIKKRRNLVKLADLADISALPPEWDHPEFKELTGLLAAACKAGKTIAWFMGAHVIKNGLGPYVSDLVQRGIIKHVAGNGAVAIHDFELAMIGETSESVAENIEDGKFGMWEETGRYMHEAIAGEDGLISGYGRCLGAFMDANPDLFPHRAVSVIWNAYKADVPFTVHVTLGADIIHQHPKADFSAIGRVSGKDFHLFCKTLSSLGGGAFLNFGSAVTGPEVFLKALSIVRNLGYKVNNFTAANFDIVSLGDYRNAAVTNKVRPEYYYRPWKNIVVRPPSLGGKGFHIQGRHQDTIPNLYFKLLKALKRTEDHKK